MFLDFLRAGLAEREKRKINWDPVDMTVLANEQVIDGRGWRSGAVVEQREMNQWVFKITKYSQELLDALDTLDRWPDKVRLMQRNWIGRSEGMLVRFALDPTTTPAGETELKIFTTRHDTLFGAKFMAIAPDHPLAQAAAAKNPKLAEFIAEAKRIGTAQEIIDTAEKQGFDTGIRAIHPFDPNWKLPVYVANFVLMEYGTGAIFGCPAHDQRDLDFVNKYGLGNTPVVCPEGQDPKTFVITDTAYDGDGRMINSRFLDGMTIEQAKEEVAKRLEARAARQHAGRRAPGEFPPARLGHFAPALLGLPDPGDPLPEMRRGAGAGQGPAGGAAGGRHLRQARQRARPSSDLEARHLPEMRRQGPARNRHHGHLRGFVLVFRALHRSLEREGADHARRRRSADAGRPVYRRHRARDPASALRPLLHPRDEGHRPHRIRRAVRRQFTQGMVVHETYQKADGSYATPAEVKIETGANGRRASLIDTGEEVTIGSIEKMSKSKRNTVDPDDIIATYGADVARWFMLSDSPPDRDVIWSDERVQGASRFVQRLWRLVNESAEIAKAAPAARPASFGAEALALRKAAHGALDKVSTGIERLHFNVCLAHIREFTNALADMLAREGQPAPDLAWAVRRGRGHPCSTVRADDAASGRGMLAGAGANRAGFGGRLAQIERDLLVEDTVTLVVQVNGKKRGEVTVATRCPKSGN